MTSKKASRHPEFMLKGTVARQVGMVSRSLDYIIANGGLRVAARTREGYCLFVQEDVDALIEERRRNPSHLGRPRKSQQKKDR